MDNENLNTGKVVDFKEIKDYQKAARDFGEENDDLEKLLLNCFAKKIETIACCGGHSNSKRAPYISFAFSPENEQLIYALLSKLKETGFNFQYNRGPKGKSFFNIIESDDFDFKRPSTLFNDINEVINSFDITKDYFEELPSDLKIYSSIIKTAEKDELLCENIQRDTFQMSYQKYLDKYEYIMLTNDSYYNEIVQKANFKKKTDAKGLVPYYSLEVIDRQMAIQPLNEIKVNIQIFENKPVEKKNDDNLKLEFQYDERTRDNPLINHLKVNFDDSLEIVAQKLYKCREKGINAFAIFNGMELNNFGITNYHQIIDAYEQGLKQTKEKLQKMRNNQSLQENQQLISENEGIKR